jgi:hypothetical protein
MTAMPWASEAFGAAGRSDGSRASAALGPGSFAPLFCIGAVMAPPASPALATARTTVAEILQVLLRSCNLSTTPVDNSVENVVPASMPASESCALPSLLKKCAKSITL